MESNKLLGLVLGIPLVFSGCAKDYKNNSFESDMPSMAEQQAMAAQTGGAGEFAGMEGQDMAAQFDEDDLMKEVVFYFDFDKSDIKESDFRTLQSHANYLAAHPQAKLRIEGHTDERGSREYNVALGERRAQSVARILMLDGAAPDQIALVSYGEEKPVMQGHEEGAWSYNRRGVLVYEAS